MNPTLETLRSVWTSGKSALDSARNCLSDLGRSCDGLDDVATLIHEGEFCRAMEVLSALPVDSCAICTHLEVAERDRKLVWGIAESIYGPKFERRAAIYGAPYENGMILDLTWARVYKRLYTWKGEGTFEAWLNRIFERAVVTHVRTVTRDQLLIRGLVGAAPETAVTTSLQLQADGTTTFGVKFSFEEFKRSLGDDKLAIWTIWEDLASNGMYHEHAYAETASRVGSTTGAVKAVVLRIQSEFKRLWTGPTLEWLVVLWVGSETQLDQAAVISLGLGADDDLKHVISRPVDKVSVRSFTRMFETMIRWGLPRSRRIIVVIDDSESLREATACLPESTIIQPCVRCLIRCVSAEVEPEQREALETRLWNAYGASGVDKTKRKLERIAKDLRRSSPRAAQILRSRIEASLAIKTFILPQSLELEIMQVKFVTPGTTRANGVLGPWIARLRERRSSAARQAALKKLVEQLTL